MLELLAEFIWVLIVVEIYQSLRQYPNRLVKSFLQRLHHSHRNLHRDIRVCDAVFKSLAEHANMLDRMKMKSQSHHSLNMLMLDLDRMKSQSHHSHIRGLMCK